MKYDFIVIGGAVEDVLIYTNDGVVIDNKQDLAKPRLLGFEYGGKVSVDSVETSFGGGAANVAVAISRLGFKVACISAVGRDQRGLEIISNFKKNKVSTSLVKVIKGQPTGFSAIIAGKDHEHVAFPVRGANNFMHLDKSDVRALKASKWIYLTSLSGEWREILDKIFLNDSAKIAWNPGQLQLKAGLIALRPYLEKTELLMLNLDESVELLLTNKKNKKYLKKISIEVLGSELLKFGPKRVLITDGANGALAMSRSLTEQFKPEPISNVINTLGMGDSFGASFVSGLELYNGDVIQSLKLAGLNASRVAKSHGAQPGLLFKKEIHEKK
ncbi:MAG: PfkB family carbohydrate kinase [bacterium]